jgi:hypothetical protein
VTITDFIEFIRDDTGRDYTGSLVWMICTRCEGCATLGGWPGAYTQADRDEWSEEDYEDYRTTRRPCEECDGLGRVQVLPDESPLADAWAEWCAEEAADRHTRWAESGYGNY